MSVTRLSIDSIAAGGDGVARHEGLVAFVPRTAPGDVVDATLVSAGRFARARVERILQPSADRVEPRCAHYVADRCGGCQLQHLSYGAQLSAKAHIVRDALVRIGGKDAGPPEVEPSPAEWRYRRKLTLGLRWTGGKWIAGLHPYDDARRVFPLRDCPITDERVLEVWAAILDSGAELPRAAALRGAVRLLADGAGIVIEGGTAWPTAERFFRRVGAARSLWWRPSGGAVRRLFTREGGELGASFVQVNPGMAARLQEHVLERARATGAPRVVDAYAGAGDTAAALAADGRAVVALELDAAAAARCAERLPAGSRAVTGRVEDTLPGALPAELVILNPPRTGLDARVTAALAGTAPRPALLYVSCNPSTLARDVGRLPGFRIVSLRSFDMFPQTAHVETVCELHPEDA